MKVVRTAQRLRDACWERFEAGWLALAPEPGPRSIRLPPRYVVGVSGRMRGGAGRTPFALGLAEALCARGVEVSVWMRGYGGSAVGPLRVSASHGVRNVGDEAFDAFARLPSKVALYVGSFSRLAELHAGCALIVDGLGQTRLPLSASIRLGIRPSLALAGRRAMPIQSGQQAVSLHTANGGPFGLVTSCARPERVLASLAGLGWAPVFHVERGDHEPLGETQKAQLLRLATELGAKELLLDSKTRAFWGPGAPGAWLRHRIEPDSNLVELLLADMRAAASAPSLSLRC